MGVTTEVIGHRLCLLPAGPLPLEQRVPGMGPPACQAECCLQPWTQLGSQDSASFEPWDDHGLDRHLDPNLVRNLEQKTQLSPAQLLTKETDETGMVLWLHSNRSVIQGIRKQTSLC